MGKLHPFRSDFHANDRYAGDVAAPPVRWGNKPRLNRIAAERTHDWYRLGRCLSCKARWLAACGGDHCNATRHQFGGHSRQLLVPTFRPAVIDRDILTFEIAGLP